MLLLLYDLDVYTMEECIGMRMLVPQTMTEYTNVSSSYKDFLILTKCQ